MSKTSTAKPAASPFAALPEQLQTAISLVPVPQNAREERGAHLNPRMGRLLRAFRAVNGGLAQTKLAGNPATGAAFVKDGDTPLFTTHCQIATLEQGGCKKGADESTIKLLSVALGVSEDVIRSLNEADLQERAAAGDSRAKKVLGIEDEPAEPEAETPKVSLEKKSGKGKVAEVVEAATPEPAPVEL